MHLPSRLIRDSCANEIWPLVNLMLTLPPYRCCAGDHFRRDTPNMARFTTIRRTQTLTSTLRPPWHTSTPSPTATTPISSTGTVPGATPFADQHSMLGQTCVGQSSRVSSGAHGEPTGHPNSVCRARILCLQWSRPKPLTLTNRGQSLNFPEKQCGGLVFALNLK